MPTYPPDGHTHTEWSWDAVAGSMAGSCARAAELGEPHWHEPQVKAVLSTGSFDRVLGSVHSLTPGEPQALDQHLHQHIGPDELMTTYLGEALRLATSSAPFAVVAHIDYPLR